MIVGRKIGAFKKIVLSNKILGFQNIIYKLNLGTPLPPHTMQFLGGKVGHLKKLSQGSETLDMTYEGLGDMKVPKSFRSS